MAPRREGSDFVPSVAESIVSENFGDDPAFSNDSSDDGDDDGLSAGLRDNDTGELDADLGNDGDDAGGDGDTDNVFRLDEARDGQLDDMRVSHTDRDRQQRRLPKKAEVKADRNGNLVDANGKIVARAGQQARFYQNMRKAQRDSVRYAEQVEDLNTRLGKAVQIGRELHTRVTRYQAQEEAFKRFNLTPEDQLRAVQFYSELRKSPENTVKRLLTQLQAQGISIAGLNNNGGVDTKSLTDVISDRLNEALNPLKEDQRRRAEEASQREQEQEALAQTQQEVQQFFRRNPDARQYLNVFQRVMANPRYQNMSLGEVYAHILRNNSNRQQPSNRQRTPAPGMPRGRANTPDNIGRNGQRQPKIADVNATWDQIIGETMDEHGMSRRSA